MSDRPVISIAFGFVCESHTHLHEYGMTHHNNVNNNTIITTKLLPQGQWFHTNKNPFKNELWPGYADLLYLRMCQAPKTVNATLMQDHLLTCLPDKCLPESPVKLHSAPHVFYISANHLSPCSVQTCPKYVVKTLTEINEQY